MKALRFVSTVSLLIGLYLSVQAESTATSGVAETKSIQMFVQAPYVMDLIHRDDIVDALYWRVREGVRARQRGLEVKEIKHEDQIAKGQPWLTVTLIHWRQTRLGDIECRISVEYSSPDGTRSLGVFDGTTSAIVRSRAFEGEDFGKAAEQAGRELGEVLRKKKLI